MTNKNGRLEGKTEAEKLVIKLARIYTLTDEKPSSGRRLDIPLPRSALRDKLSL